MPDLTSEFSAASRLAIVFGACLCFFAVAIGAFGAHALADVLLANQRADTFELANRYQFYHGLALLMIGVLPLTMHIRALNGVVWMLLLGTVVFSGSLYCLSLTNIGVFGAITPIGGVLLLVAWAILIYRVARA